MLVVLENKSDTVRERYINNVFGIQCPSMVEFTQQGKRETKEKDSPN